MDKGLVRISKFLSLVLRHRPERIGLRLDEGGWAEVDQLLDGAEKSGFPLDRHTLQRVVEQNDKQRYSFSSDGLRIRANQGHSISVDLGLTAIEPPELLYHGTAARFRRSIGKQGLHKRKRHHVHLSPDIQTAQKVGSRRGEPVVLTIHSGRMHRDGFEFYRSENGIWLTSSVPVQYIVFPEDLGRLDAIIQYHAKGSDELMDQEPRLLVWNYTPEEKERLDALLNEMGAPAAATVESSQGHLTLRQIIHANTHGDDLPASEEKVLLFYNIPRKGVFFLIDRFKQANLPRPIYAVVTEHTIEWPFSKLLEHLVSERDGA